MKRVLALPVFLCAVFVGSVLLASTASAQVVVAQPVPASPPASMPPPPSVAPRPGPGTSYLSVHGELASKYPGVEAAGPSGLAIDWGGFQNRFVGAGTRIGISRAGWDHQFALLFGGGPQFHIPIGDRILLVPALNLALRLSQTDISYAAYGSLAAAYRMERYYLGLEAETPIYLQSAVTPFLPGGVNVDALFGFYF